MVTLEEAMRGSVRSVTVRHNSRAQTYQVKIPAGVTEGQRLKITGRGEAGSGGGTAGDLYLRVRLARHPDFTVEDHDLIYEAELAPWEAVLGANISVPTLGGNVNIKIPPGTQNGQKLRLRGRGLPQRGGGQGDLIVVTRIEVPKAVTDAERKVWEQLAHESKFNPRD
jgi:curved DNA-binding protein